MHHRWVKSIRAVRTPRTAMAITLVLVLLAAASGCSINGEQANLVTNGALSAWNDETGLPIGWKVEGEGLSIRSIPKGVGGSTNDLGVVEARFTDSVLTINSPFFFSAIKKASEMAGRKVSFSVWVKTDMADTVFLEVSDREGHDHRSSAHPGTGDWQRLNTELRVPSGTEMLEFRVRFNRPAIALVKGPYAING